MCNNLGIGKTKETIDNKTVETDNVGAKLISRTSEKDLKVNEKPPKEELNYANIITDKEKLLNLPESHDSQTQSQINTKGFTLLAPPTENEEPVNTQPKTLKEQIESFAKDDNVSINKSIEELDKSVSEKQLNTAKTFIEEENRSLKENTSLPQVKEFKELIHTNKEISGVFASKFSPLSEKLDTSLIKTGVYKSAKNEAKEMIQNMVTNDPDLLFNLKMKTESELKDIIANGIGSLKNKYTEKLDKSNKIFNEYEKKYNAWNEEITKENPNMNLVDQLKNEAQQFLNDNGYKINVFNNEGGLNSIRQINNRIPKMYDHLSDNKKELVNSILQGIRDGFPDKVSDENITTVHKDKFDALVVDGEIIRNIYGFKVNGKSEPIAGSIKMKGNDLIINDTKYSPPFTIDIQRMVKDPVTNENKLEALSFNTEQNNIGIKGKDIETPETIKLGDKTYGAPIHLGDGGTGRIYKYTNIANPNDSIVIKEAINKEEKQFLIDELEAHYHSMGENGKGHENIVHLTTVITGKNDTLYMVMPMAKGGDLSNVSEKINSLESNGTISKTTKELLVRSLLSDAMKGMQYLQNERGIMHLDIKPYNFMISEDGTAMVGDFGSAKLPYKDLTNNEMTKQYASPERADARDFDMKTDTWSLGMLLNEMTLGKKPFVEEDGGFNTKKLRNFGDDLNNKFINPKEQKNMSSLDKMLNSLLDPDPEKRPSLDSVVNHSLFSDPILSDKRVKDLLKKIIAPGTTNEEIQTLSKELERLERG